MSDVRLPKPPEPVRGRPFAKGRSAPCRERTVRFVLPPIESAPAGEARGLTAHDVSAAMNAVTAALAGGIITPGEAERIATVVDTFVRAIDTTKRSAFAVDPPQILGLANFYETDGCYPEETDDYDFA